MGMPYIYDRKKNFILLPFTHTLYKSTDGEFSLWKQNTRCIENRMKKNQTNKKETVSHRWSEKVTQIDEWTNEWAVFFGFYILFVSRFRCRLTTPSQKWYVEKKGNEIMSKKSSVMSLLLKLHIHTHLNKCIHAKFICNVSQAGFYFRHSSLSLLLSLFFIFIGLKR